MRKLLYIISVALILGLAAGCDRKGAQLDRTFERADALMTDHPDSALAIMQAVDTAGLSRGRLARYALLLTKALNKSYKEPMNDTLIKIAVDYYCGRGNDREMESLYFYGIVLANKDSFKVALPYVSIAYDMAKDRQDWLYMGLSGRLLSGLYKFLYDFKDQKKYAVLSKEAFLRYEKESGIENLYSAFMDYMIAESMLNNGECKQSLQVCNNVDSAAMEREEDFRHLLWITKAHAYNALSQPERGILLYDTLRSDGYVMEGYNWARLAQYHLAAGNIISAQ
ncbi:MAG: hypothetical protein K2K97_06535, partial [Muribaculaceae bacterium]|nr:hypothetical protein [Muribaculaceae bacterium]